MINKNKLRIVQVDWEDSASTGGWRENNLAEQDVCCRIRTVGYVVHRDKEKFVITQSVDKEVGKNTDRISIPTGCIKRVRYLRER